MAIQQDKLMHYLVGSIIALLGLPFIGIAVMFLVVCVAIGKELYDHYTGTGTPEYLDIVWTILGGLVVTIAYLLNTQYLQQI